MEDNETEIGDKNVIERYHIEKTQKWREWIEKIPFIKFPPDWEVQVIPPFAGAMARFQVRKNGKKISVYLDVDNSLGYMDGPYWEAYPIGDDTARFMIDETTNLIATIEEELSK